MGNLKHATAWMNIEDIMLHEKKNSHKKTNTLYLYEASRVLKFIETEWQLPGVGGKERWKIAV